MESGNFQQFSAKKGFEIAYALFRVSTVIPQGDFRSRLERSALAILEYSSLYDSNLLSDSLALAGKYLHFGEEFGFVSNVHAGVIRKEIMNLSSEIAGINNPAKLPDLDIAGIFTDSTLDYGESPEVSEIPIADPEINGTVISAEDDEEIAHGSAKSAMRQSAILEKVRQIGNCRMRDLEDLLPKVSERTLRYDLQQLVEQGLIEKVGTGGPAVFYRMRVFAI